MPWTLAFVLAIFPPLAGMNYYVGQKVFRALVELTSWDRRRLRLVVVGVHLFLNLLPVVYFLLYLAKGRAVVPFFGGDYFLVDVFLSYPFWMALVVIVQLFILYAALDILSLAVKRFLPPLRRLLEASSATLVFGLLCFIVLYSIVPIVSDTWTVRVLEHEVTLPDGYTSLSGFRIAEISDVQVDGRTTPEILRRYVERVNGLHPDLILFAGDLVTSGTSYIDTAAQILGQLRARCGTIAAVGDHDIFTNKSLVLDAYRKNGITAVEDTTLCFQVDSSTIALSVVTYTYPERPTASQLEKVASGVENGYKVFLVHQPAEKVVAFAHERGYQLLLAGHTHGGAIAFGIPGLFLLAPSSFETRYVSGAYHVGQMIVSVTNGLGFTLAPIRYHAPAEIVLITLK
jgi:predicted MPP superfamily phosphohydrolase